MAGQVFGEGAVEDDVRRVARRKEDDGVRRVQARDGGTSVGIGGHQPKAGHLDRAEFAVASRPAAIVDSSGTYGTIGDSSLAAGYQTVRGTRLWSLVADCGSDRPLSVRSASTRPRYSNR